MFRYVDFIVHEDSGGSADIPYVIKLYNESQVWYVAARFEYEYYMRYVAQRQFTIGNGSVVVAGGVEYMNGPLKSGKVYMVYVRVIAIGDDGVCFV